jgi:hypothetical protein
MRRHFAMHIFDVFVWMILPTTAAQAVRCFSRCFEQRSNVSVRDRGVARRWSARKSGTVSLSGEKLPLNQGGEIGRRARLRIAKSSISQHRFSFQKKTLLRWENDAFSDITRRCEGRVESQSD